MYRLEARVWHALARVWGRAVPAAHAAHAAPPADEPAAPRVRRLTAILGPTGQAAAALSEVVRSGVHNTRENMHMEVLDRLVGNARKSQGFAHVQREGPPSSAGQAAAHAGERSWQSCALCTAWRWHSITTSVW